MFDDCIPTPLLSVSILMWQPVLFVDARARVATGPAWGVSSTRFGQNAYDQAVGVMSLERHRLLRDAITPHGFMCCRLALVL